MPELPEVETIKNELLPHVLGREITGVTLFWEGIVRRPSPAEFSTGLTGQRIAGLARRGKYLIFKLSGGDFLVMHLKMSGSLLFKIDPADLKYVRALLRLDDGTELYFRDPRKFGGMWLVADEKDALGRLGPEPLEEDFTVEKLAQMLRGRTAPVKALITDQRLMAGVGNMYADEALFAARIHPLRPGGSLSREEIGRLYRAIQQVLKAGIGNKGASVLNYFRPGGEPGTAHHEFKVAHRGGKPCPRCGSTIQRIAIRKRGSYFCPKCQPAGAVAYRRPGRKSG